MILITRYISETHNRDVNKRTVMKYAKKAKEKPCCEIPEDLQGSVLSYIQIMYRSTYCRVSHLIKQVEINYNISPSIRQIIDFLGADYRPLFKRAYSLEELIVKHYSRIRGTAKNKIMATKAAVESETGRLVNKNTVGKYINKNFPEDTRVQRSWSSEEVVVLNNYAGFLPFPEVCNKLNRLALQKGQTCRTPHCISQECFRLGLSVSIFDSYVFESDLCRGLGVTREKLSKWLMDADIKKILKPQEVGNHTCFLPKNVCKFIQVYAALLEEDRIKIGFLLRLISLT